MADQENPAGLTCLSQGAENSVIEVDIVFVHGLRGSSRGTWTTPDQVCWPRDLLANDLPTARVFTWGYDSSVLNMVQGASNASIFGHANNLLNDIYGFRLREKTVELHRPIIFVCHSLGGIVFKQEALVRAKSLRDNNSSDDGASVFTDCKCVLFFGTPHLGGNRTAVKLGKIAANIARVAGPKPNKSLLRALEHESEVLENQQEQFVLVCQSLSIGCITEEKPCHVPWTRLEGTVVPSWSAKLVLTNCRSASIAQDHFGICKFASKEDAGYRTALAFFLDFLNKIQQATGDPTVSTVVLSASSGFVGRKGDVKRLEQALEKCLQETTMTTNRHDDPGRSRRLVITGLGGQGKSEICLQVIERMKSWTHRFWGIFWVDVHTEKSATSDFLRIADKLKIRARDVNDVLLAFLDCRKPWLLVLDNADDPHFSYQRYFAKGPFGTVLLTSRNPNWGQHTTKKTLSLGGLDQADAVLLLLATANIPDSEHDVHRGDAEKICQALGSHPLALLQAGAYISKRHCTIQEYPKIFEKKRRQVLKSNIELHLQEDMPRYSNVFATFEATIDTINACEEEGRDALQLLRIFSVLAPSQVPEALFVAAWKQSRDTPEQVTIVRNAWRLCQWHVRQLPILLQSDDDEWDPYRLNQAVELLKSLSFLYEDTFEESRHFFIHPLVHAWANARRLQDDQTQSWIMAGSMIALSVNPWAFYDIWAAHERQLRPHLHALFSRRTTELYNRPKLMVAPILVILGWLASFTEDHATSLKVLDVLITRYSIDCKLVTEEWLPIHYLKGVTLRIMGKPKDAVVTLEQVVDILSQKATNHSDLMLAKFELARAYRCNGGIEQALPLLEKIFRAKGSRSERDDSDFLDLELDLGVSYTIRGQFTEGLPLIEHVVKTHERTLRADHPHLQASRLELAAAYRGNGQLDRALPLFQNVEKIREQTLRKDHPELLSSKHELAMAYRESGQIERALSLIQYVVGLRERTLTEDHPNFLASKHELALNLSYNGEPEQALELFQHVVKVRERTLPEDHPDLLSSQHGLARCYHEAGQTEQALKLVQHVVRIGERTLPTDHPSLMASMNLLASMSMDIGQGKRALELFQDVVDRRSQALEDTHPHPSLLRSKQGLAYALWHEGHRKEGLEMMKSVLNIYPSALTPDNVGSEAARSSYTWMRKQLAASRHESSETTLTIRAKDDDTAEEVENDPFAA